MMENGWTETQESRNNEPSILIFLPHIWIHVHDRDVLLTPKSPWQKWHVQAVCIIMDKLQPSTGVYDGFGRRNGCICLVLVARHQQCHTNNAATSTTYTPCQWPKWCICALFGLRACFWQYISPSRSKESSSWKCTLAAPIRTWLTFPGISRINFNALNHDISIRTERFRLKVPQIVQAPIRLTTIFSGVSVISFTTIGSCVFVVQTST